MRQPLRHRYKPGALLTLEGRLVDALHHFVREARAIAEDHISFRGPFVLVNVAEDDVELGGALLRPTKNLFVRFGLNVGDVRLIGRL